MGLNVPMHPRNLCSFPIFQVTNKGLWKEIFISTRFYLVRKVFAYEYLIAHILKENCNEMQLYSPNVIFEKYHLKVHASKWEYKQSYLM